MTIHSTLTFQEVHAAKVLGYDVPPEDQTRVKIKIKSRCHGQVVCGEYVEAGETVRTIYRAHVPEYMKLLETASPAEREQAQRQYELDVRDAEGRKSGVDGAEYRKQHDPSYPAAFRDLFRRDLLPFDSVEVIAIPAEPTKSAPQGNDSDRRR